VGEDATRLAVIGCPSLNAVALPDSVEENRFLAGRSSWFCAPFDDLKLVAVMTFQPLEQGSSYAERYCVDGKPFRPRQFKPGCW